MSDPTLHVDELGTASTSFDRMLVRRVCLPGVIEAPMYFLERSKMWDTTKPYNFLYYLKEDFPRSNLSQSPSVTRINDMRSRRPPASLEVEGFAFYPFSSKMQYSDFMDDKAIESVYCQELENHFLTLLGAKHVRALDYQVSHLYVEKFIYWWLIVCQFQVRRRLPGYPYFGGKIPPRPQPSLMTHVGNSTEIVCFLLPSD